MQREIVVGAAYERVLEIETALGRGTAFTITEGGAQYVVTAKHLLPPGDLEPRVALSNRHILEQFGVPLQHDWGIISASEWVDDVHVLYLDGLNNPGFSGGPVVGYHHATGAMHVFGVVSGYRTEQQPVYVGTHEIGTAQANTGIVIATWIDHVTDAIKASVAQDI